MHRRPVRERSGRGPKPRLARWPLVVVVPAVLSLPAAVPGQEASSTTQQTQGEIPANWADRLGICRRTDPGCGSKSMIAVRVRPDEGVEIDAVPEESVWRRADWRSDFVQRDPVQGARPTVRTEVAFAYDEATLYVAARLHDPEPSQIRANLARRDDHGESDRLTIAIDSYEDRHSHYAFTVTAAGGRVDYFGTDDQNLERDLSYDPIWVADARVTETGWSAEMAIPFSQIRFNRADSLSFGINVNRYRPSNFEDLFWIPVPKDESGWTSWFGDLAGLNGVDPRRPVEVLPYFASNLATTSEELLDPGDPFAAESDLTGRIGADVKIGIGSGLTLDATFNPDFGQVEADPAEVNLSAVPTFFPERRPFFVENADLLEANDLFFSRRIGAAPRVEPGVDFADVPESTTILGAAKLTGRTAGGLSIGALGAVTAEESATTYDAESDSFGTVRIEPLTSWLVLRGRQDFGRRDNSLGVAFTGVQRDLPDADPLASQFNREAYAGGADLSFQFGGGLTTLEAVVQGSHIAGKEEAIGRVQQSSSHYFQRPDARHVEFDSTRTSLSGYRASLGLQASDGRHWRIESLARATSPEFEINDAGALGRADRLEGVFDLSYAENAVGTFQGWSVGAQTEGIWNYGGNRLFTEVTGRWNVTLRNLWSIGGEVDLRPGGVSDTETRGGPLIGTATELAGVVFFNSDPRERLTGDGFLYLERDDLGGWVRQAGFGLQYRPGGALQVSVEPIYTRIVDTRQYVTTAEGGPAATFGRRYVFGRIDRHTLAVELRVDYAFTPDLSLEAYFEPFIATGRYTEFGELTEPGRTALRFYGTDGTSIDESTGRPPHTLTVRDGPAEFAFHLPDFRAPSFRSNLVARWEWAPGSTLYLVWQLDRGGFAFDTDPAGARPRDLFEAPGEPGRSLIAVKATYWLPM